MAAEPPCTQTTGPGDGARDSDSGVRLRPAQPQSVPPSPAPLHAASEE